MLERDPPSWPPHTQASAHGVAFLRSGWGGPEEDEKRVRWAFGEARRLVQRYSGVREALQERMSAGVSAGECVVLIEEQLKNAWVAV